MTEPVMYAVVIRSLLDPEWKRTTYTFADREEAEKERVRQAKSLTYAYKAVIEEVA
jgi:saccharopine dehydrogenase-like NADP-dependent oxidoreductase